MGAGLGLQDTIKVEAFFPRPASAECPAPREGAASLLAGASVGRESALPQLRRAPVGRVRSDGRVMTGIFRLEPWVTVPDPVAGQKLELDPCGQMGGGQGQPFPVTGL